MTPGRAPLVALCACSALLLTVGSAAAADVVLRTDDGVTLAAVWYAPSQPAPAVLLLHSYLRTHTDWDPAAAVLHDAGFGVLELDLRGHGGSGGSASADQFQRFARDVTAAVAWLRTQPTVLAARIGIAGFNLGATLAVVAAGADPGVRSLALISPALEFRGLHSDQAMHVFAARSGAALLIAGANDPYGARSARQLADITPGVRDLRLVDGSAANGRALLADEPDLMTALVDWFRKTLL